MAEPKEPDFCGICLDRLTDHPLIDGPVEGRKAISIPTSAISKITGAEPQKQDAKRAFELKVGLCPDCLNTHEVDVTDEEPLSHLYEKLYLGDIVVIESDSSTE